MFIKCDRCDSRALYRLNDSSLICPLCLVDLIYRNADVYVEKLSTLPKCKVYNTLNNLSEVKAVE